MDRFLCHVCEFQNEHTPQEFQSLMIENISQRVQKGIDLLLVNIVKLMKSSKLSFSDKSRGSLNSHHHHTNYFLNYWIHENTFQSRDLLISKICSYISNSLIENNDESFQYMIIKTDDQHSSSELLKEFCELNSTSDPMNHHHNEYFQLLNKLFEHAIDNHAPNWMDQQPLATTSASSASTATTTTTTTQQHHQHPHSHSISTHHHQHQHPHSILFSIYQKFICIRNDEQFISSKLHDLKLRNNPDTIRAICLFKKFVNISILNGLLVLLNSINISNIIGDD